MSSKPSQLQSNPAASPARNLSDSQPGPPQRESHRDRQRAATRERVFLAAVDEFLHVGFPGAHIDRIAAAAGVSRGTFYFHFPTKEHVLVEIQRRSSQATIEQLAALRTSRPGLREILACLIESIGASEFRLKMIKKSLSIFSRVAIPSISTATFSCGKPKLSLTVSANTSASLQA